MRAASVTAFQKLRFDTQTSPQSWVCDCRIGTCMMQRQTGAHCQGEERPLPVSTPSAPEKNPLVDMAVVFYYFN